MGREMGRAEAFAAELERAYGGDLVSAALYGSAARGEFEEGVSDLNLLVLLRDTSPATLRRGSELARSWVAEGNPPPLLLSEQEWRRSADVFPIEVGDIRDAHRVLRGGDPFEGVSVRRADLRHQCEHELKGKQIQLRERYLLSAGHPEELEGLLLHSISTFVVLFRSVLRLVEDESGGTREDVVRRMAAHAGFDPAPLVEILVSRREKKRLGLSSDSPLLEAYLDAVHRVVEFVDRLPPTTG